MTMKKETRKKFIPISIYGGVLITEEILEKKDTPKTKTSQKRFLFW